MQHLNEVLVEVESDGMKYPACLEYSGNSVGVSLPFVVLKPQSASSYLQLAGVVLVFCFGFYPHSSFEPCFSLSLVVLASHEEKDSL